MAWLHMIKEKDGEALLQILIMIKIGKKKIDKKYVLEKSINWKIAIVKEIKKFEATIETIDRCRLCSSTKYHF